MYATDPSTIPNLAAARAALEAAKHGRHWSWLPWYRRPLVTITSSNLLVALLALAGAAFALRMAGW